MILSDGWITALKVIIVLFFVMLIPAFLVGLDALVFWND